MAKGSVKEAQEKMVANLKQWQKVENASVVSTGRVMEKTENPVVRLIMEIVQRDSQMHYRVQEMIVSSMEKSAIALSPDDLDKVWSLIEAHIQLEKETIALAEASIAAIKGKGMVVQSYLLDYLLKDEEKHNAILENLEKIKKGMHPYGS